MEYSFKNFNDFITIYKNSRGYQSFLKGERDIIISLCDFESDVKELRKEIKTFGFKSYIPKEERSVDQENLDHLIIKRWKQD